MSNQSKQITLAFTVCQGHQVASGRAVNSPYPAGTIALQAPFFKQQGVDLSNFTLATINAEFAVQTIKVIAFDHWFEQLNWYKNITESFGLTACHIKHNQQSYNAYIYTVDAKTKVDHFQATNVLEIIAESIADLNYGDHGLLVIEQSKLTVKY